MFIRLCSRSKPNTFVKSPCKLCFLQVSSISAFKAAKRSRERKKRAKEGGQASTSEMDGNILSHEKQLGMQDSADMASADMAKEDDVANDDVARMLTWQRC